jgi:hypothetical protein
VVIGRPLDPFFLQKKLLMPKPEIKIRLHRSSPNVYLEGTKAAGDTSTAPYKLVIEEIKLMKTKTLRRVLPHPSIISKHNSALGRNEKVIYPMELVDVRQYPIQMSSKGNISNVIYSGRLPRKLTIGLTMLSAAQGDMTQGSFYYERFNLSKASVIIDSETLMIRSYDLETDGVISPYLALVNCSRKSDFGCRISIEDFKKNGRFLLVFDLNSGCKIDLLLSKELETSKSFWNSKKRYKSLFKS